MPEVLEFVAAIDRLSVDGLRNASVMALAMETTTKKENSKLRKYPRRERTTSVPTLRLSPFAHRSAHLQGRLEYFVKWKVGNLRVSESVCRHPAVVEVAVLHFSDVSRRDMQRPRTHGNP